MERPSKTHETIWKNLGQSRKIICLRKLLRENMGKNQQGSPIFSTDFSNNTEPRPGSKHIKGLTKMEKKLYLQCGAPVR